MDNAGFPVSAVYIISFLFSFYLLTCTCIAKSRCYEILYTEASNLEFL